MIHRQVVSIRHKYVDLAVLYRPENKYFLSTSSLYVCYREYHGTISISFFLLRNKQQNDRLANPPTSTLFLYSVNLTEYVVIDPGVSVCVCVCLCVCLSVSSLQPKRIDRF